MRHICKVGNMKDTEFCNKLLGLKTPWTTESVDISIEDRRIVIWVGMPKKQVWADPTDDTKRAHINKWTDRQWKHMENSGFETIIKARVPQLKYSTGQVEEVSVPWARRYGRVTLMLEAFVVKLLEVCSDIKGVCEITKLDWSTVNSIMLAAVERGLLRRKEESIKYLGIDEKSAAKGHNYVSILTDIEHSRVLDVVPERKIKAAKALLNTLTPLQKDSVEAIAMDMWPAYINAAGAEIPNADIVHDKFHISKYLNNAVDKVRYTEHKALGGDSPLLKSKYKWLGTHKDKRSSEAIEFRKLNQLNLKTSRAWRIKETFRKFWSYSYRGSAKSFFDEWSNNAMRSRLEPVKKVVKMLRKHEDGLLNYSKHKISNAAAEGFNSKIQLIKANARGFKNFSNYRARILFRCGKLDMHIDGVYGFG